MGYASPHDDRIAQTMLDNSRGVQRMELFARMLNNNNFRLVFDPRKVLAVAQALGAKASITSGARLDHSCLDRISGYEVCSRPPRNKESFFCVKFGFCHS